MTKEKIVAGIEKYVDALTENEKSKYKQALTKFTLAEIKDYKEANPVLELVYPVLELAYIVQELQQEIKEQAQKEAKGNTFVKRSKLITKLLEKSYNEKFKKGFIEEIDGEKMKCCIIDGYYAFMLKDIDMPMIAEDEKPQFTIKKILPNYKSFAICDFDIADIKMALKLHKAKKDKTKCLTEINGKYCDTSYFINVIDGLGGDIKMYQNNNPLAVDVFESENGIAVLMPCRPPRR